MGIKKQEIFFKTLQDKALWVRIQTLLIHKIAPQTRLASSLSDVEIFVTLYYGRVLNFDPQNPAMENRDRFIISKGHGAISLYPILADLGFFEQQELSRVCKEDSFLGGIPDILIPGFETINGSLGHGLGVGCGIALALKRKHRNEKVIVLISDGELFEGSVWESVMFAGEHKLDNLITIIDNNKVSMLDFCKNIIDLEPLEEKFKTYRWMVERVDGHNIKLLYKSLMRFKQDKIHKPKVLIADTVKGKGVASLENNPLSHIKALKQEEIDKAIEGLK